MKTLIQKTKILLTKREKIAFVILAILLVASSLLEVLGIAVIIPYIKLLETPDQIHQNKVLDFLYQTLHAPSYPVFFVFLGLALMIFILFKYLFVFVVGVLQSLLLIKIQIRFEKTLLASYLNRSFEFHLLSNPSTLYQNVRTVQSLTSSFLLPFVSLVSELCVSFVMVAFMIYYKPKVSIAAMLIVGVIAGLFWILSKKKLYTYGQDSHQEGVQLIKWLNQSFVGIKDIKISGTQNFFVEKYIHYSYLYSKILQKSSWLNQAARPILEASGFCLLLSYVLYNVYYQRELSSVLPVLILFAGAAFRVLPAFNRILGYLMMIKQSQKVSNDILDDLRSDFELSSFQKNKLQSQTPLSFDHSIEISNLSFSYKNSERAVIDRLNLKINKGDFVGIVGPSGSGKTTLVDLLLGLLPNYQGEIKVDHDTLSFKDSTWDVWQQKIGYVPQSVYLYDDSVEKNVAFGVQTNEINREKVIEALERARLGKWIKEMPHGVESEVGDRGVRVSGGQKQRIGIARAFYRNSDILILDEVTSALDEATEAEMIEELKKISQEKTVIMITHRQSTLKYCNKIYKINNGKLEAVL